jgi:hypothetical protein
MAAASESDFVSKYNKLVEENYNLRKIIADLMMDLSIKDDIYTEKIKEIMILRVQLEVLKEKNKDLSAASALTAINDS